MSHTPISDMTREQVVQEILAAERETHELLERAASACTDPEERALFERLARREEESLEELRREEARLEAEEFVQRALDC
jgi:rubrerythrin